MPIFLANRKIQKILYSVISVSNQEFTLMGVGIYEEEAMTV
jgi:hypothetical protein